MGDDALAHRLGIGDEVLSFRRSPDHRRHKIDESLPEFQITSGRSSLKHRLELPGLGPFFVVDAMTGQRAYQLARLALRSQGRVDLPDRSG